MPQQIIIAYDHTDADALNRRMNARADHFKVIDDLRGQNKILIGIAIADDSEKMIGSVLVTNFDDRAELDEWLAREPYVVQKVWKDIQILKAGKLSPSFAHLLK